MAIATKQWTTGTVTAGSSLECNLVMDPAISLFAILKLEITPSAAGGLSTYQIWDTDGYDENLLYDVTANALSPYYDPVKIDSNSNMTEQGPAMLFMYEDADDSDELHIKIGNQAGVDRTYTVKIWFWNAEASTGMTSFDVAGDEGSNQTVTNGSTLTFSGVSGITFSGTAGGIIAATVSGGGGGIDTSGTPVQYDIARFTDADTVEGRSYAELKADLDLEIGTDVLAQQTIGIGNDNLVEMDDTDAASGDYAKFTANGLEGRSATEVRSDLNVEDGADATDADNVAAAGAVMDADFTAADEVMVGTGSGTHGQVTLAASQFLGKKATGAVTNLTAAEARTILNVADGATADQDLSGLVTKATFNANTILKADSDDTPAALTVGEQTIVGRITSGVITALTPTEVRTMLNVADGATADQDLSGLVAKSTFNAQTILAATTDDTPAALEVTEQTLVGRITSGNIAALSATQVRTLLNVADGATADQDLSGLVTKSTFDANTILKADSDDTPTALTVGEQTLVGRITSGVITALSATQVRTLLNVADGATVDQDLSGLVTKSTYDANTILKADSDDTPAALTVGEQTLVGRITSGVITALSATQVRTLLNVADGADVTGSNAPQAHKDSHDPEDGSDKLDTAAPAELASVQAAATGSSHSLARADHQHQIQHSIADNHIVTIDQADAASGEFTRLTANGLESRSDAEMKTQLGYLTDVSDDTTPELGGELDCGAHSIGFTQQSASGTSPSLDLRAGNSALVTCGAGTTTVTFSNAPSNPGNFTLQIKQDGTGSRDVNLPSMTWMCTEPTWTDGGANKSIFVMIRYDGSAYWALGATDWES